MRVLQPILRSLIRSPRRTVIIDDQRSWKAFELYLGALHVARAIERASDRPNVGLIVPTSGLAPLGIIATWMLGRTAVPLNYLLKGEDLEYVIDDAEIDTVVTVGPMLEHIGELPSSVKTLRLEELKFGGIPPLRRAVKRPDDHLAALLYTSGTSGKPKGVMLTSGNLSANVQQAGEWAGFDRNDVFLGVLPQFHSFGLTVLTVMPLSIGARVIYTARFSPRRILTLLEMQHPTVFVAIPSMYNALLSAKGATEEHFAGVKWLVSGGEPLPRTVAEGFREQLGATINEGYGLTETAPVTNWCRPHEHKPGSVGRPLPQVEERIIGPDGAEVPPGGEGEVRIKGPNVMAGYYKREDDTNAVFDEDGFFRTGDMGRFDEDGHLYITGRIKEMLIIGGENVFPREIEEVVDAHPSVHASAVVGQPDPSRGEVAIAFVELEEGADFDESAIRAHCRDSLAQYKVPREIRLMEALPRNPTGKIMRRVLAEEVRAEVEAGT